MPGKNSQFSEDISLRDKYQGLSPDSLRIMIYTPDAVMTKGINKKINQRKYHAWMQKIIII